MAAVPYPLVLEYQRVHIAPGVGSGKEIRLIDVTLVQVGMIINNHEHLSETYVIFVHLAHLDKAAEATAELDDTPVIVDCLSSVFDQQARKIVAMGGRKTGECLCHLGCVEERCVERRGKDSDPTTCLRQYVRHHIMRLHPAVQMLDLALLGGLLFAVFHGTLPA